MLFWTCISLVCLMYTVCIKIVSESSVKLLSYALIISLWFFTSFRYMIGWDYQAYVLMFYNSNIGDYYPEFSFNLMVTLLRNIGFEYQSVFLFYATLTLLFLWMGINKYTNNRVEVLLIIVLYIFMPHLYWYSLSAIRQELAMAIFFWGSYFLFEDKTWKFFASVCFAAFWHYSALFLIVFYLLYKMEIKLIYHYIIIFIAIILGKMNIAVIFFKYFFDFIGKYQGYAMPLQFTDNSTGLGIVFFVFMYLICTILLNFSFPKNRVLLNMSTLFMVSIWVLTFSDAIYRFSLYFIIFYTLLVGKLISKLIYKRSFFVGYIFLFLFAFLFLNHIAKVPVDGNGILHPFLSANNITYKFNFELF